MSGLTHSTNLYAEPSPVMESKPPVNLVELTDENGNILTDENGNTIFINTN